MHAKFPVIPPLGLGPRTLTPSHACMHAMICAIAVPGIYAKTTFKGIQIPAWYDILHLPETRFVCILVHKGSSPDSCDQCLDALSFRSTRKLAFWRDACGALGLL